MVPAVAVLGLPRATPLGALARGAVGSLIPLIWIDDIQRVAIHRPHGHA
jgi:hypothetical protein